MRINRQTPRLVDVLPNGPVGYGTVQVFLAGGVPEVMLHLRDLGLLRLNARTVNGMHAGRVTRLNGSRVNAAKSCANGSRRSMALIPTT